YIAMILFDFTIAFGTRHLDAAERHEFLVASIAFDSLVMLFVFIAVDAFVIIGLFDCFTDLFALTEADPRIASVISPFDDVGAYASWAWLTVLSMLAILFLPRQF